MDTNQLNEQVIKNELKNQYHASFDMLGEAIGKCPEDLLYDTEFKNTFWQLEYTIDHSSLLMPAEGDFIPWKKHQIDNQYPDGIPGDPDPDSKLPLIPNPYTKEQLLEYWGFCKGIVDEFVDKIDLKSQDSGFSYYLISKFEHQLVNIRHLQHGAAQLADRLRLKLNIGIQWADEERSDSMFNVQFMDN